MQAVFGSVQLKTKQKVVRQLWLLPVDALPVRVSRRIPWVWHMAVVMVLKRHHRTRRGDKTGQEMLCHVRVTRVVGRYVVIGQVVVIVRVVRQATVDSIHFHVHTDGVVNWRNIRDVLAEMVTVGYIFLVWISWNRCRMPSTVNSSRCCGGVASVDVFCGDTCITCCGCRVVCNSCPYRLLKELNDSLCIGPECSELAK